jgi:predicted amidohydrolase YtcJ
MSPPPDLVLHNGNTVLPGLFDAHPHADREGLKARGGIPIAGLYSVAEMFRPGGATNSTSS